MRILTAATVLAGACRAPALPGPAVRLASGASDTVIINSRYATPLSVRALDAAGRTVARAPIRYAWAGGDSLPVTTARSVTRLGDGAAWWVRARP